MNEVFAAACEQPPSARRAFVERECAAQPELAPHVLELLDHDDQPAVALDQAPLAGVLGSMGAKLLAAGAGELPYRIGSYRILSKLGEGGFGVVYLAEQENPRRQVALKVMRPGFFSPQSLRRFESEAHALGRLQHIGIAHIHEAGVADIFAKSPAAQGNLPGGEEPVARRVPFFAMEYVRGRTLRDYAQSPRGESPLSTRERLELFARVCDALDHAHRNGVIHRDLKPDNIVVEERPDQPPGASEPVARAAGDTRSRSGRVSGTLLSSVSLPIPKILDFGVARLTDSDVQVTTMRTDVGQLIGTLPYMSPEQVTGDPGQVDARSDVYSAGVVLYELLTGDLPYDVRSRSLLDALKTIREAEPKSPSTVNRTFRGDIAVILSTALEKDKTRRYQSAALLAADIRSYLAGEPIAARHASALYVMRKRLRRYGVALAVSCGFVVFAATAAAWLSFAYGVQSRLVKEIKQERDRAVRAEGEAGRAQRAAEIESENARQVADFLQELLASADPSNEAGREATIRELLDRAAARVENPDVRLDPGTEAQLRRTIGRAFTALRYSNAAEPHLRRYYELVREVSGPNSLEYANAIMEYYAKSGGARNVRNLLGEARRIFESLGQTETEDYATLLHGIGIFVGESGDLNASLDLFKQGLAINRRLAPQGNGHTIPFLVDMGRIHRNRGEMELADSYVTEAVALSRRQNGPEHGDTAITLHALGMLRLNQQRFDEAETALREAIQIRAKVWGADHPDVALGYFNLGGVMFDARRYAESADCFRRAAEIARGKFGEFNIEVARFQSCAAMAMLMLADFDGADEWESRAIETNRVALPESEAYAGSLLQMAKIRLGQGKPAEALAFFDEGWSIRRRRAEQPSWNFGAMRSLRGKILAALGRDAEAERELLAGWSEMATIPARYLHRRVEGGEALVDFYTQRGCMEDTQQWRRELAELTTNPAP
ncbi:MAG: serine/threonine protein kinase [Phycisphaerales bacterium]|nr:serine/threonine protein kinase [Phycisphaerales bacterium]